MEISKKTKRIVVAIKGVLCIGWGVFCIFAIRDALGDTFPYRSAFATTASFLCFEKFFEMVDWILT